MLLVFLVFLVFLVLLVLLVFLVLLRVGVEGLEPSTLRLSGVYSKPLSYMPVYQRKTED